MKAINIFRINGVALILIISALFNNVVAQSHNVQCASCKYYQRPADAKNVVNTGCVCESCREKDKKERESKQAEDKRRQAVKIAENQRKAKQEAERKKLEQEKNKPTNVVISAPKTTENATKIKVETNSRDLKEWTTFEDENSRPSKIGFKYYDSENRTQVIKIPAKFNYHARSSSFKEGSKYTAVQVTGFTYKVSPCKDNVNTSDYAIINRKGDIVVSPPNNTTYFVIQPAPFAIEFSYGEHQWGNHFRGCSAKIFNIETKEVIAELTPNYILNKYGVTSQVFVDAREKMYFPNQTKFIVNDRRYASEEFVKNLQREFATGKYSVFLIYPDNTDDSSTQYTGFLLGNNGNYKVLRESWLRNIEGGYR